VNSRNLQKAPSIVEVAAVDNSGCGIAVPDLWVHEPTIIHEIMDVKGPRSAVAQGGIYRFDDGRTRPDLLIELLDYPGFTL
jgi:hypothetical protein